MSWLNWSLKFHIRLRTISHLISTHITHDYVQWMPYSFMWLYLIKCVVHTQSYVDQTQKYFLSIFSCLWKVFCFEKFQKIQFFFFFLQLCFDNSLAGYASSCDSLASESPSCKKNFENFSKFMSFCHSRNSFWWLGHEWKL